MKLQEKRWNITVYLFPCFALFLKYNFVFCQACVEYRTSRSLQITVIYQYVHGSSAASLMHLSLPCFVHGADSAAGLPWHLGPTSPLDGGGNLERLRLLQVLEMCCFFPLTTRNHYRADGIVPAGAALPVKLVAQHVWRKQSYFAHFLASLAFILLHSSDLHFNKILCKKYRYIRSGCFMALVSSVIQLWCFYFERVQSFYWRTYSGVCVIS